MIIFNWQALLVAIVIVIVYIPLILISRDFFLDNPIGQSIILLLWTLIAGFFEMADVRGRLFWFIPLWLIGAILLVIHFLASFGWAGIGYIVLFVVGVVALFLTFAYFSDKKDWEKAQKGLVELNQQEDTNSKFFWQTVKKALYMPEPHEYDEEICVHNLKVLGQMKKAGVDWVLLDRLIEHFKQFLHADGKVSIPKEDVSVFNEKVGKMLERL